VRLPPSDLSDDTSIRLLACDYHSIALCRTSNPRALTVVIERSSSYYMRLLPRSFAFRGTRASLDSSESLSILILVYRSSFVAEMVDNPLIGRNSSQRKPLASTVSIWSFLFPTGDDTDSACDNRRGHGNLLCSSGSGTVIGPRSVNISNRQSPLGLSQPGMGANQPWTPTCGPFPGKINTSCSCNTPGLLFCTKGVPPS